MNIFLKIREWLKIFLNFLSQNGPNKNKEEYSIEKFEWEIKDLAKGTKEIIGGLNITGIAKDAVAVRSSNFFLNKCQGDRYGRKKETHQQCRRPRHR